jgi:hypothetical protein
MKPPYTPVSGVLANKLGSLCWQANWRFGTTRRSQEKRLISLRLADSATVSQCIRFQRAKMFSGTYIRQNPAAEKYLVLAMDFGAVQEADVMGSFTQVVNTSISGFSQKYNEAGLLSEPIKTDGRSYGSNISNLAAAVERSGENLSLIVDEVDSFTNRLLLQVCRENGLNESGFSEFVRKGGLLAGEGRDQHVHQQNVLHRRAARSVERRLFLVQHHGGPGAHKRVPARPGSEEYRYCGDSGAAVSWGRGGGSVRRCGQRYSSYR